MRWPDGGGRRRILRRATWGALALALYLEACAPSAKAWDENIRLAEQAYQQGRYAEAERLLQSAIAEAQGFSPEDGRLATALDHLEKVYRAQERPPVTEPSGARDRTVDVDGATSEAFGIGARLDHLTALYISQGKYADAERLFRLGMQERQEALGPSHPDVANSLQILAELSIAQGKYADAEPLLERALEIREKLPVRDEASIAATLNDLGLVQYVLGKYAQAEPLLRRALHMREKALGPTHGDVAASLENYAALLRETHRVEEAAALDARAVAIRRSRAPTMR